MKRRMLAQVIVLALAVAACSGGEDAGDATVAFDQAAATTSAADFAGVDLSDEFAEEAPAAQAEDGERALDPLGNGGVVPIALQIVDLGRDIIFTADLTVAVSDVAAAGAEATQVVQSLGGFLFGQQTTGAPNPRSVLTFKILPENFQDALSRLGEIGELRTQNVSADDVTERVVDLESRIATAEASVERLKSFLDEANDIVTIAELESQLLDRETQLETLRGQLRTIRDQVDLATIVLTLTESFARPSLELQVTAYPGRDDAGLSCPGSPERRVDKGDDLTICFDITNTGDTDLTDFEVTDSVLDLEIDDLVVVFGDPDTALQPGQTLTLAADIVLERSLRTQTRVSATPVDPDGRALESRGAASTDSIALTAEDPGGVPGFSEGLEGGVSLLAYIGRVVVLIAGAVLPFVWLIPLAGLLLWWQRRRRGPEGEISSEVGSATESDPGVVG